VAEKMVRLWPDRPERALRPCNWQAGMTSEDHPERLVIALEPEAASIYVRKLRLYQLVPETTSPPVTQTLGRAARTSNRSSYHVTADNATTSGIPSSAENYLTKN